MVRNGIPSEGRVTYKFDPQTGDWHFTIYGDGWVIDQIARAEQIQAQKGSSFYSTSSESESYTPALTFSLMQPLEIETYYPRPTKRWPGNSVKSIIINKWNDTFPRYAIKRMTASNIVDELQELKEWKYQVERAFSASMNYPFQFDMGVGWAKQARQVVENLYKDSIILR